jgi:DNA-directed RNA polymerase subunit RPC12/RpoP
MIKLDFLKSILSPKRLNDLLDDFMNDTSELDVKINSDINSTVSSIKDRVDKFFYSLKLCEHDYQRVNDSSLIGYLIKCSKCGKVSKSENPRIVFIKEMLKRRDGVGTFINRVKKNICTHDYVVTNTSKDNKTKVLECSKCGKVVLKEQSY